MKKEKNGVMSEVTRVRFHIMNMIYRSNAKSVMIPSVRSLAAEFGIARSTVQIALERLSQQGYVTGKPGIGTFTNPMKNFSMLAEPSPLVGLKVGTGDYFYYGRLTWSLLSHTGMSLTDYGFNLRQLTCATPAPEDFLGELKDFYLNGLICIQVPDELLLPASRIVPTINIGRRVEGVDGVYFSYENALRELAGSLQKEKRHRILSILQDASSGRTRTIHAGLRENAPECEIHILDPRNQENIGLLEEELRNHPPDALLFYGQQLPMVMRLLEKYEIDPVRQIRLIAIQDIGKHMAFHGIYFQEPHQEACEAAAELMSEIISGKKQNKIRQTKFDVELIYQ